MQSGLRTELARIKARLQQRRQEQQATPAYCDPVVFARRIGFEPDPWQERVLSWTGTKLLMNVTRQGGKSSVAAIVGLHQALYTSRSLVLLVSPSLRQSQELYRKVRAYLNLLQLQPVLLEDNRLSLELANHSRVVSLPSVEGRVRGFSAVDLVIEDESARVLDDLYFALRPCLAVSGGRSILMSTPFGKRGHFYELWENGEGWERVKITASECPRISPEFLEEERRSMPAPWFASEYLCEFGDVATSVFATADIEAAMSDDIVPLFEVIH